MDGYTVVGHPVEAAAEAADPELTEFMKSKENHKYPGRAYLRSDNLTIVHTLTAIGIICKASRLHFECEAKGGAHVVPEQEGLELFFKRKDRFYIRTLWRKCRQLIWLFLKIGAQVLADLAVGSLVPGISNLALGLSIVAAKVTENLMSYLDAIELNVVDSYPPEPESIWLSLRSYVAPKLTPDHCASWFNLHLVRYRQSDDSDPFAWLCEECVMKEEELLDCSSFKPLYAHGHADSSLASERVVKEEEVSDRYPFKRRRSSPASTCV